MKDLFTNIGNNFRSGNLFNNPLTLAGFQVMRGVPLGEALIQGSEVSRQNQIAQAQSAHHQAQAQELARKQLFAQSLPQAVQNLNAGNVKEAFAKLINLPGADEESALKVAKGIFEGGESDFFTGPGRVRYMVRRNPETGQVEAQVIPGQNMEMASAEGGEGGLPFLKPEKKIAIETGLRKEITSQSKNWNAINDAYGHIKSAAKNPSPAGDIALIYGYMKMLDPTSVVREGEYATAANAGGVPERIRARYNQIVKGERLTPEIRKDFVRIASDLHKNQKKNHTALVESYRDLAARSGVNPSNVILPLAEEEAFEEGEFNSPQPVKLIGEMSQEEIEREIEEEKKRGK